MRSLFIVVLAAILMAGCATARHSVGRDFSVETVKQIKKGETTSEELKSILGEPYSKSVTSETEEKWIYMYIYSVAHVRGVFVPSVKTTGIQKNLDILIKDGTVVNYAYTEGQPGSMTVNR